MVTAPPVLVSYEESLLRPESSLEEVVNGELHTMPPVTYPHTELSDAIHQLLANQLDRRILKVKRDVGYLIAERPRLRYRIPDLAVVNVETSRQFLRQLKQGDPYARFAPIAVVEVLSPSNRKGNVAQLLQDYRDLGVGEIVFLDPHKRIATVNGETSSGEVIQIAGITINLGEVWRVFEEGE